MVHNTAKLGGTASSVTIAKVGHGLMKMTWGGNQVPDDICFDAIKAGLDALPDGVKMHLNSAEFYGTNPRTANLELLARFFDKYPGYSDKVFLSVKGSVKPDMPVPDNSPENIIASVENCLRALRGTKSIDLFECARVDPDIPIEDTVKVLSDLVKQGKFDHVGLSECSGETVRRANKIHPIAMIEIEVSPWAYTQETKDALSACSDLGIAVAAYSPLGQGFLTGKISSLKDIDEGDARHYFTRFQEENMKHNMAIVKGLSEIAERKGCTTAQLSIAWVSALGPQVVPIPGSSKKERTLENLNAADVVFSRGEINDINEVLGRNDVKGSRYFEGATQFLWG